MPAASHVEKAGTFTNTQRLIQFRDKALDPPGDARSELWFMHHLFKRVQAHYAGSRSSATGRSSTCAGTTPSTARCASPTSRTSCARSTATRSPPAGPSPASPTSRTTARRRAAAGSTRASSPTTSTRPGGATRATLASPAATSRRSGRGRGRPTAACSTRAPAPTPDGKPWSERKKHVWWDEDAAEVDRLRRPGLPGRQAAGLQSRRRTPRAWTRSAAPTRSS